MRVIAPISFRIRLKVSLLTFHDVPVRIQGLQRPCHTLLGIVHTGLFAVAIDVRKNQEFDLIQLLETDDQRFAHDKPGEIVARRIGGAAIVAPKEDGWKEFFVGVKRGRSFLESSNQVRIVELGGVGLLLLLLVIASSSTGIHHFTVKLRGRPSTIEGLGGAGCLIKVVGELKLIQNILKCHMVAVGRGPDGDANGGNPTAGQMGMQHLDLCIELFTLNPVFPGSLDVEKE